VSRFESPLAIAAREQGDNSALLGDGIDISCTRLAQLVTATIARLDDLRINPGDRTGILSDNSIEQVILLLALIHRGAVACPISSRFPDRTITGVMKLVDCNTLVVGPAESAMHQLGDVRNIAVNSIVNLSASSSNSVDLPEIELDRDSTVILTSGTTAIPKAVVHTFGNHYYNALGSNENIRVGPGDCWLLSLPLYHVGGIAIIFRCLLAGATMAIPSTAEALPDGVRHYSVSHLSLVATQLRRMLNQADCESISLRHLTVLLGGAANPTDLIARAHEAGVRLFTSYGLTEMASQVTTTRPEDSSSKLTTAGRPLKYRDLKISEQGEILVRGETLFRGYLDSAGVTRPMTDNGWFATGDLGYLDADGYLTVTGRADNMFISGGENIQPEEIEQALYTLDSVAEAVVVPIAEDEFGHRPAAFVKSSEGFVLDNMLMCEALGALLPRFKIPVRFFEWPQDYESGSIKPDREYLIHLAEKMMIR